MIIPGSDTNLPIRVFKRFYSWGVRIMTLSGFSPRIKSITTIIIKPIHLPPLLFKKLNTNGTIMHKSLLEIVCFNEFHKFVRKKKLRRKWNGKAILPGECRKCPWLTKCYGGCTKDRIKDPQDKRKPRFCLSYKMFFAHADDTLQDLALQWQRDQQVQYERQQTGGTYNAFKDFMK